MPGYGGSLTGTPNMDLRCFQVSKGEPAALPESLLRSIGCKAQQLKSASGLGTDHPREKRPEADWVWAEGSH